MQSSEHKEKCFMFFYGIGIYLKGRIFAEVIDENTCIETLRREADAMAARSLSKKSRGKLPAELAIRNAMLNGS